jgi:hypothetical protein
MKEINNLSSPHMTPRSQWHSQSDPELKIRTAMKEKRIEVSVGAVNVEVGFVEVRRKVRRLRDGAFIYFETEIFLSVVC